MRKFRIKTTDEINGNLYLPADNYDDVAPGLPLRLHSNGTWDPPEQHWDSGEFTITLTNQHQIYVCQSWRDSVTVEGNQMVAMVPLSKPWSAYAIMDADDFTDYDDIADIPLGTQFAIIDGKLAASTAAAPPIMWIKSAKPLTDGEYEVELSTVGMKNIGFA